MWLLVGNKTQARRVPDGREVERACRKCGDVTWFVECDVKDEINAFFIKVFETTQRRMVCFDCGDDTAMDTPAAAPVAPAVPPPARTAPPPRKAVDDASIDSLLSELKRKLRDETGR
jgi:hypothetical protein